MGSSSSKAAQTASKIASSTAPKAARRYPTRTPPAPTATSPQRTPGASTSTDSAKLGPTVHPDTLATDHRDAGKLFFACVYAFVQLQSSRKTYCEEMLNRTLQL